MLVIPESITHYHLFTTDDASSVAHLCHLHFSCIGVTFVHISSCVVVADERTKAGDERPSCNIYITNNIQRHPIERENESEECQVRRQLEEVCKVSKVSS